MTNASMKTSVAAACAVSIVSLIVSASAAQGPDLAVVEEAASYLDAFEAAIAGVVMEEQYSQQAQVRTVDARQLVSDLVIVSDDREGWVEFRDIHTVDGRPVSDREKRVVALFSRPDSRTRRQAVEMVKEGSRFNLTPRGIGFERTLNLPLTALRFLVRRHQPRMQYTIEGQATMFGRPVIVLRYEEVARPRIVWSPDAAPSVGRFWIESGTGRVLQSEMQLTSRARDTIISSAFLVQYTAVPELDLWLPGIMEEDYVFMDGRKRVTARLSGRALYANAKRFGVTVDEQVATP